MEVKKHTEKASSNTIETESIGLTRHRHFRESSATRELTCRADTACKAKKRKENKQKMSSRRVPLAKVELRDAMPSPNLLLSPISRTLDKSARRGSKVNGRGAILALATALDNVLRSRRLRFDRMHAYTAETRKLVTKAAFQTPPPTDIYRRKRDVRLERCFNLRAPFRPPRRGTV